MLELNQLTGEMSQMATVLAGQRVQQADLVQQARQQLQAHGQVTQQLREKLATATTTDLSWRGADPLTERLDERRLLPVQAAPATLMASDGSQIYPDPHGIALYYLLNVGTIILRQESGTAPDIATRCQIFYHSQDLYQGGEHLIETDQVNLQRDRRELQALAQLAQDERELLGGDLGRPLVALVDGPLLPWMPQRLSDAQQAQQVSQFAQELDVLRRLGVVPLGYVDRPRSANVLRLLHLAGLHPEQISQQQLRDNPFGTLSDRHLFGDLRPGQRTALFAATSEINETYAGQGHRICFCYLNMAVPGSQSDPIIVRVEVPEWAVRDQETLDAALAAIWSDCKLTGYPYVLTRAHELARVSRREREALEEMLQVEMMRQGLWAEASAKQQQKMWVGG